MVFSIWRTLSYTLCYTPTAGGEEEEEFQEKMEKIKKKSMYANQASKQEEEGTRAVWMMKLVEWALESGPVSI